MVVAVEMLYKLHLAVDGEPVGMYVERTHEDRNHQSFVVEILVLLCFLNHDDLAVGRCHNEFIGVAIEVADRTAVEVERHHPGCAKDEGKDYERYF